MTNFSAVENKITAIKKYLSIAKKYQKYSQEEIEKTPDLKGAVERYLYLVCQASIDLAEAVISIKNFRKPTTYRESFKILGEEEILPDEVVEKLIKMAGFRNFIAHDYSEIDYSKVYDVLQNGLNDIEDFILQIKNKIL